MDVAWLVCSILLGAAGFVLFVYGKRQTRVPQMVCGLVLMVYPYFVANAWVMLGIGAALVGVMWFMVRLGY